MLPAAALGWWGMLKASAAIQRQTHAVLRAASDGAEAQLREFLRSAKHVTEAAGEDKIIQSVINGSEGESVLGAAFAQVRRKLPEAQELFCLDSTGRVVAASNSSLAGQDLAGSTLFNRGKQSYYAGDVLRARDGILRWRMSAPVKQSGETIGVVVLGIDPEMLSALTSGQRVQQEGADTQSFRIGKTGETYLVNRDGVMITHSRYVPDGALKIRVNTFPVREWRERGNETLGDYRDYRGVPVSGASAVVNDPEWLLLTEIDFSQALAPIARLRNLLGVFAIAAAVGAALVAANFAGKILRPLTALTEADEALARGHEDAAIVSETWLPDNEIGQLVKKRNNRIRELFERQRELAREQRARAEASAELERITYSMVHDMRAPLRAVISYGHLLHEEARQRLNEAEVTYIERMRSACARMDHLICDLLRYSSLLQQDLPVTSVNIRKLLADLIAKHPGFRDRGEQIELQPEMPQVIANGVVLAECLTALLENALKFGRPGVSVTVNVRAQTVGDRVKILVEDDGIGMAEPLKEKVFGIFQRGSTTSAGTGIGLAVVRAAVERMGGRVGVESEIGNGSRFWIELKRSE